MTRQTIDARYAIRNNSWKEPVRAATTANVTISTALNNGDTLDGVSLVTGDRVLVKDQTADETNGIYVVGASPVRAADFDTDIEVPGAVIGVKEGTANADTAWLCTTDLPIVLGTDPITFTGFGSGGSSSLTVAELDGTPTVIGVTEILVTNGTLTDNGGGSVTITITGGSAQFDVDGVAYRFPSGIHRIAETDDGDDLESYLDLESAGVTLYGANTSTGAGGELDIATGGALVILSSDGGSGFSSISLNPAGGVIYFVNTGKHDFQGGFGMIWPRLSANPSGANSVNGQGFYNTTTHKFMGYANGTWVVIGTQT